MNNINEIHRVVREELFGIMPTEGRMCFSYLNPEDAGPATLGDLFEQDLDFLMAEVMIERVERAGPSIYSPRRVWGSIEFGYHTKDRLDPYRVMVGLEGVADHFREETLQGVRFRDFVPTGEVRDRGFTVTTGVIPFDFETRAKHAN